LALTPPPAPKRVFLVGMMGAGKSATAKLVAAQLGWAKADTDEMVERVEGMTVAALFKCRGEEAFRDSESGAIKQVGQVPGPVAVSVGGGAVLRAENRASMRALGTVVWLRARPRTLAARVGRGDGRPLLAAAPGGGPAAVLEKIMAERAHLYEEVADVVIDVDDLSPAQVARLVVAELEGRPLGSGPP
jgi:shikimate kinase